MKDAFAFEAEIWEWGARASWYFVTLPLDAGEEIRARFGARAAGFGSLKVAATIGSSTWETSIFPDNDSESYVLPLKKPVRVKEGIDVGDTIKVTLQLLV